MTWQSYAVQSVVKPAPDAVIGVTMGGDFGYRTFALTGDLGAVQPQVGDNVIIDVDSMPGGSQPVVVRYPVANRIPAVPNVSITVSNTAPPAGLGLDAVSAIYSDGKRIWFVRSTPAPPSTVGSMTVLPAASRTWDPSNNWRSSDTKPRQGSFGSGINKGCWFYPSGSFSGLSSHTGVTATLTVTRDSQGGTPWSPKQLVVWAHNYVTQPTGEPAIALQSSPAGATPGINDTVTFTLPSNIVAALVGGTAVGVAIASEATSDYLICLGPDQNPQSGALTFQWAS